MRSRIKKVTSKSLIYNCGQECWILKHWGSLLPTTVGYSYPLQQSVPDRGLRPISGWSGCNNGKPKGKVLYQLYVFYGCEDQDILKNRWQGKSCKIGHKLEWHKKKYASLTTAVSSTRTISRFSGMSDLQVYDPLLQLGAKVKTGMFARNNLHDSW